VQVSKVDIGKYKVTSKSPKYEWVLNLDQELKDLKEKIK